MIIALIVLISLFNSISELSNHGKLNHWPQWWQQSAWINKNTWKPIPLWSYWPFIIFTDAFHFFKTLWVICMCLAIYLGGLNPFYSFAIYSFFFEVFYSMIPYFRVK
jgi:hypothetical protein